ncbi:MAG: hypothetical protein V5A58_09650 [Salinibacter sp.]|uniref:hypothetical protein n=1 Tax=Salinibacter sp. TaxID=2065818 RepID=UPI002FC2F103
MVIPILTLILGIIGGAAVNRYLQRRRRRRRALEEIETVLFEIQRYCWKLNGEITVTSPETYPYGVTEMTTEEAQGIMRRLSTATENLERRAFEATRILRKYPSLPHRREILDALYGEDFPTIEERAWRIAEIRGRLHDEIKGYAFDTGGEFLEQVEEYRSGHVSAAEVHNHGESLSPILTESGLRSYITAARDGLHEIM